MKQDIILAGVGGQGILSVAFVLVNSAMLTGLNSKQSEVHGMSQRGGPVFAYVRISDDEIYSDLIPTGQADMIVGLEAMESLRYTEYLKEGGYLLSDKTEMKISGYNSEKVQTAITGYPNNIFVEARKIAKEAGNRLAANMVMAGIASRFMKIEESYFVKSIEMLFGRKSQEIVDVNLKAFRAGALMADDFKENKR